MCRVIQSGRAFLVCTTTQVLAFDWSSHLSTLHSLPTSSPNRLLLPLQERDRVERERVVRQKVAASTFSRGYLSGIISSVFDGLAESGHFFDPVLREVETAFMPWLKEQAAEYLSQGVIARQVCVRKCVCVGGAYLPALAQGAGGGVPQAGVLRTPGVGECMQGGGEPSGQSLGP